MQGACWGGAGGDLVMVVESIGSGAKSMMMLCPEPDISYFC
jgi:hypothetical protein